MKVEIHRLTWPVLTTFARGASISTEIASSRLVDDTEADLAGIGFTLARLRNVYGRDTSELPSLWTAENPRTGQCHVTSLIVAERHGGRVLLGWTTGGVLHYWNVVDGITVDATRDQFPVDTVFDRISDATNEVLGQATIAKRDLLAGRAFGEVLSTRTVSAERGS